MLINVNMLINKVYLIDNFIRQKIKMQKLKKTYLTYIFTYKNGNITVLDEFSNALIIK